MRSIAGIDVYLRIMARANERLKNPQWRKDFFAACQAIDGKVVERPVFNFFKEGCSYIMYAEQADRSYNAHHELRKWRAW